MSPPLQYHILQAAGLAEPSHSKDEIMGQISLKHAYEIAKFHAQDEWYVSRDYTEKDIVHLVVQEARKIGVEERFALRNRAQILSGQNFKS